MRFLLVDDSKPMRMVQKNLLLQIDRNAEILEAANGAEALEILDAPVDLVLLDYNMPGKDGVSFVRDFRHDHPNTPVIMVTGEAERSRVITAIQAGVTDYVVRPFAPDLLQQRIESALARSGRTPGSRKSSRSTKTEDPSGPEAVLEPDDSEPADGTPPATSVAEDSTDATSRKKMSAPAADTKPETDGGPNENITASETKMEAGSDDPDADSNGDSESDEAQDRAA